jgi:hypothetical protein
LCIDSFAKKFEQGYYSWLTIDFGQPSNLAKTHSEGDRMVGFKDMIRSYDEYKNI